MTAKELHSGDLFNTDMFHNKRILEMVKMLRTMKETKSFTENNVDMMIDSRGIELRNAEKKEKKELFRKELA